MRVFFLLCLFLSAGLGQTVPEQEGRILARTGYSVSDSKIFTVYGDNGDIRSALTSLADEVTLDFSKLIQKPQKKGKYPVIVTLHGKLGEIITHSGIRQELRQVEDRYLLQLHVHLGRGFRHKELAFECLELLLHIQSLESMQVIPEDIVLSVPPWLVQGLLETSAWKKGEVSRVKYEMLKRGPELFDVERLLNLTKSDLQELTGPSRELFEASSGAMVLGLLGQPEGVQGVIEMISSISVFEGEIEDLLYGHFPGLNSGPKGIDKWWNLQIANMALPKMTDLLDMTETEDRLTEILHLYIRDELGQLNQSPMSDFQEFLKMEEADRKTVMEGVRAQLIRLNFRCFPLYRPFIVEYLRLIASWQAGEDKESIIVLDRLSSERKLMSSASVRSRDYLDWYLITHSQVARGDFSSYLRLKEQMIEEREQLKDELIDSYLDDIQAVWDRNASQP